MCRGNFPSRYMTIEGRALKEDYQWQAKEQWKVGLITEDIALEIHLYFGDKRLNDWDNFHKISMDALTGIVWEDDSQIKQALVIKDYDKENPRIEIKLSTLQD